MNNFICNLKNQLAKKLRSGLVNEYSNFCEKKTYPSKRRQKETFDFKVPIIIQEEDDVPENLVCEFSKEIELLYEGKNIFVTIEQYVSNAVNIRNNDTDILFKTDPEKINFNNSNIDYTIPLDLEVQELDASVLQCESFINYQSSGKNQPISRDVKIVLKDILEENRSILNREDFLKPRYTVDKSDATCEVSLDLMKEDVNKIVVKQEELFIKDEPFDSQLPIDVLPTQNIGEVAKLPKKVDNLSVLNKSKNYFNEFVKQVADSINCDRVESLSDDFRISHLERSQSKPWYITCSKCDFRTKQLINYTSHVKVFHSNSDSSKSRLIKVEATPLNSIYQCQFCDYSSSMKATLKRHIKSIHYNRREFKCHLCNFSANRISSLTSHLKCVHLKIKSHYCNFCDYATARKFRLTQHIDAVHKSIKKYKCDLCDYMGTVKSYVNKHRLTHFKRNKSKKKKTAASLTVSKCFL